MSFELPQNPRILIIKLSSLGDIVHAMPAVKALSRELQPRVLHWVAQPEYHGIISCCGYVQRSISYFRRSFASDINSWLKELRAERYDLAIDLQGLFKSSLNAFLSRSTRRIGPARAREGSKLLYHETVEPREPRRHAVDCNLDILDHLGLDRGRPEFDLSVPAAGLDTATPRIAVAPFSRHANKNWPRQDYTQLARSLQERHHATIYIIGSESDAAACETMQIDLGSSAVNLAGRTSLAELASLLGEVDVVISNDSGPMHIADAVGTPVVGLFTGTDPLCYGPYGERHVVLSALDGDDLTVEAALEATEQILARP